MPDLLIISLCLDVSAITTALHSHMHRGPKIQRDYILRSRVHKGK